MYLQYDVHCFVPGEVELETNQLFKDVWQSKENYRANFS